MPAQRGSLDGLGPVNVKDAQVYLSEGEYAAGTILFADDPERRAEITWLDSVNKRSPTLIRIQIDKGGRTRWRTPQGLTTGLGLAAVERLEPAAVSVERIRLGLWRHHHVMVRRSARPR